jgi:archaemetzincin
MRLDLVPVYLPDAETLVAALAPALERTFGVSVRTRAPWFDPETCYDSSRGQYNSTLLLGRLLADSAPRADRVLAVTGADLFVPVLAWVFGEAQLDGPAAVVSTHRLRDEAYGLPADPARLRSRLQIEAVHELGHTFGLVHCVEPTCVMRASTYVEEIDLKTPRFCGECARFLPGRDAGVAPASPDVHGLLPWRVRTGRRSGA